MPIRPVLWTWLMAGWLSFSWDRNEDEKGATSAEGCRLLYVAMTHAKDQLFLLNAAQALLARQAAQLATVAIFE
jgi:ATP-dependent exoDNAse (exonuclease V) beta subunit